MKIFILIILLTYNYSYSEQFYEFANSFGSTGIDLGGAVAYDSDGNVYVTGYIRGTVDMDPGAGVYNLTSISQADLFISKFNSDGDFVWAFNVGGPYSEVGFDIEIDPFGDIIVSGYFNNVMDFDPSGNVFNRSASNTDGFLAKYDTDGNLVWVNDIGGVQYDEANKMDIDEDGNIYIVGNIGGTSDFDASAGTYNIAGVGGRDIFFAKYDNDGNIIFAEVIGSVSNEYGLDIKVNSSKQIYITGYFAGTLDFDPGAGVTNVTSQGGNDMFLAKYDSNGDFLWVNAFGSVGTETLNGVELDDDGNVLVVGHFDNTIDFDPGAGTRNLTSNGLSDIVVASYSSSGVLNWAHNIGGTGADIGNWIYTDEFDNFYITGSFYVTVDFDPSSNVTNLTSSGGTDIFVATYDFDGDFQQAFRIGGTGNDLGRGIVIDDERNIFLCGDFSGTVDFDPSSSTNNRSSAGGTDLFLLKYSQTFPPTLTTNSISSITRYSAKSGGAISDDGNSSILSKGVVWSTSSTFEIGNTPGGGFTSNGSGSGSYESSISGLSAGTTYYVKAYATNSLGTGYGNTTSFRTKFEISYDGNQDGIPDTLQSNVSTLSSIQEGSYLTLVADNSLSISDEVVSSKSDSEFTYPFGITEFKINASNAQVKIYYHGYESLEGFTYKKLFPDGTYKDYDNVEFGSDILDGERTAYALLTLVDGGLGDYDGVVNGVIYDPGGPAIPVTANIPYWSWWYLLILLPFTALLYKKTNHLS